MFSIVNAGTNYCALCPPDPGLMASGGNCWISDSQKTQVAMLLQAKALGLQIWGRVNGISTDCTMYQLQLSD
jgi:hypothetical protein